ncbi:uncharacterized protein NECHADRAFT_76205 [Fusarium vanettenii 77-13-4]|uniref:RING-type domain-containing protein n=1 Tax=Fusarium vanettenii (strain ATCC MYA-4622 / CBS 123669 / FGSC 9596 / NRRL 45880 / 77-13-4) TaxID=660122 RepID=C7Z6T3_FUSV7|nr:uncharacterized protein NECHADRAFT_76205 [Fusarium vanettenii 77-13-4]EEU40751.1 hypothetical protein NECHADRAFT_76205 [Fusarium vanettenii 77-13-4]
MENREPEQKRACMEQVVGRFHDIDWRFVSSIAGHLGHDAEKIIGHILERQNLGYPYPKEPTEISLILKDNGPTDVGMEGWKEKQRANFRPRVKMIAGDFPYVPMKSIMEIMSNNKNHLYPSYMATLEIAAKTVFHGAPLPWTSKRYPSPLDKRYEDDNIFVTLGSTQDRTEGHLITELALCRLLRNQQSLRLSFLRMRRRDAIGLQQAMASGQASECEGCFTEYPMIQLIHCNGDQPHLFCPKCCATNADSQIAQSKYELRCISTEDCSASFSVGESSKFLSAEQVNAIDRARKEAAVEKDDQQQ